MPSVGLQGLQKENRHRRSKESCHFAREKALEKGERGVRGVETENEQQSQSTPTESGDSTKRDRVHRRSGSVAAEQQILGNSGSSRFERKRGRSFSAIRDGKTEAVLGPFGKVSTHQRIRDSDGIAIILDQWKQLGSAEHDRPEHQRSRSRDRQRYSSISVASMTDAAIPRIEEPNLDCSYGPTVERITEWTASS